MKKNIIYAFWNHSQIIGGRGYKKGKNNMKKYNSKMWHWIGGRYISVVVKLLVFCNIFLQWTKLSSSIQFEISLNAQTKPEISTFIAVNLTLLLSWVFFSVQGFTVIFLWCSDWEIMKLESVRNFLIEHSFLYKFPRKNLRISIL